MPAGRPLEPAGNGRPRWMTVGRDAARRPVHRIRLTGQLVRPTLHRLRQREDAAGLTRKALATSPGFSMLLDVRRPGDGPGVDLGRWVLCGIPSIWRSPTARPPGGNSPMEPARASSGCAPGMPCGSPPRGRWDATPRPPNPAAAVLEAGILEICPPGEGPVLQIDRFSGRPSKAEVHATEVTLTSGDTRRWSASHHVVECRFVRWDGPQTALYGTCPTIIDERGLPVMGAQTGRVSVRLLSEVARAADCKSVG